MPVCVLLSIFHVTVCMFVFVIVRLLVLSGLLSRYLGVLMVVVLVGVLHLHLHLHRLRCRPASRCFLFLILVVTMSLEQSP